MSYGLKLKYKCLSPRDIHTNRRHPLILFFPQKEMQSFTIPLEKLYKIFACFLDTFILSPMYMHAYGIHRTYIPCLQHIKDIHFVL